MPRSSSKRGMSVRRSTRPSLPKEAIFRPVRAIDRLQIAGGREQEPPIGPVRALPVAEDASPFGRRQDLAVHYLHRRPLGHAPLRTEAFTSSATRNLATSRRTSHEEG